MWGLEDASAIWGQMPFFPLKKRRMGRMGKGCPVSGPGDALGCAGPELSSWCLCVLPRWVLPREGGGGGIFVGEIQGGGLWVRVIIVIIITIFCRFSLLLLPSCLPARRRLSEGAGEGGRKPLPGAPEHRATAPHLPLGRRGRNLARPAQHTGAGPPWRPAGERRSKGGGLWRSPTTPRLLGVALETRCTG